MGVKMSCAGVVVRNMTIKRPSPSQFRERRDGGRLRIVVFLVPLLLVGMVMLVAVDAEMTMPTPTSVKAAAPSAVPPPPPLTALRQSQEVVRALRANNFTTVAQLIQTYLPILRLNSTLFIPTNEAVSSISAATPILTLLLYHAVTPQYSFDQLVALPTGTRLPTSLFSNSILVTNNARDAYQIDNVRIVMGDACVSNIANLEISCHGVEAVLNATLYGNPAAVAPAPAPLAATTPIAAPVPATSAPSASPPVPFILPGSPAVPVGSPEVVPVAESPVESENTGGASASRLRPPFRHLLYVVFLGVMSLSFGL